MLIRFYDTPDLVDIAEAVVDLYNNVDSKEEFIEGFKDIVLEARLLGNTSLRVGEGVNLELVARRMYNHFTRYTWALVNLWHVRYWLRLYSSP